jgi:hypothetical protein
MNSTKQMIGVKKAHQKRVRASQIEEIAYALELLDIINGILSVAEIEEMDESQTIDFIGSKLYDIVYLTKE